MRPKPRLYLAVLALCSLAAQPASAPQWGFQAHALINEAATTHLPADFQGFAQWSTQVALLASAADQRKGSDPGERIRHYIDIDDYPEFFSGQLPRAYTEMVAAYGLERIEGNGTLPWAIDARFDDLVQAFSGSDWDGVVAAAADIGHYVGDLHNPLHLTLNFNGQLSGQTGIHSRFESQMTSRHLQELTPSPGNVEVVTDPLATVFGWIDEQYAGLGALLAADSVAQQMTGGNTSSTAYYDALWAEVGDETVEWIQEASERVASLWYAAWIEAGSPALLGTGTDFESSLPVLRTRLLSNSPNPFSSQTNLHLELANSGPVLVQIFDLWGRRVRLLSAEGSAGWREIAWNGTDDAGGHLASGVYHVVIQDAAGATGFGQVVYLR